MLCFEHLLLVHSRDCFFVMVELVLFVFIPNYIQFEIIRKPSLMFHTQMHILKDSKTLEFLTANVTVTGQL